MIFHAFQRLRQQCPCALRRRDVQLLAEGVNLVNVGTQRHAVQPRQLADQQPAFKPCVYRRDDRLALGAVAGKIAPSLPEAMKQFTRVDKTYRCEEQFSADHQRRYEAYKTLQHTARLIRE